MRRRDFLKAAAAVTSGLSMANALEAEGGRIRCGLLGIDHAHGLDVLGVLSKSPDFALAGVCEPDESIRREFAAKSELRDVRWLTQDELLGDGAVQMIAVESGVSRLLSFARAAIDANKHVHMDKPAGVSLEDFRDALDEASRRRRLLQMGYMFRYNPGFDLMRRAVKEGWLGEVYAIHASMCTDLNSEKRKRIAAFPGGIMLELGCHLIDMVHVLMGAPTNVTPFVRHDGPLSDGLADNTLAVLEYPKALVSIESAVMEPNAFPSRRFKVAGTNGSFILSPLEPPSGRLSLRRDAGEYKAGEHSLSFPDLERHVRDFEDLAACIRGEREFQYSNAHDLAVQRTVLLASGML